MCVHARRNACSYFNIEGSGDLKAIELADLELAFRGWSGGGSMTAIG
jgi:hypothetical protein